MIRQRYGAGEESAEALIAPSAFSRERGESPFRGLFAGGLIITTSSILLWWLILAVLSRLLG